MQPEIYTADWARQLGDVLSNDERFRSSLATWDGAFALRDEDGARAAFRVYLGRVIDAGRRVGGRIGFTVTIPRSAWQRMIDAPANTYLNEAMLGSFRAEGDGYEYIRLTKALSFVVDAARQVAGKTSAPPVAPGTRVASRPSSVRAHYLELDDSLGYVEVGEAQGASRGTLLLLHTAGQSGVQYRRVVPRLNELGYRTIVPDYPGHGRSEPAPGGPVTDLGEFAEWIERMLALLPDDGPLYVAGCSIGGKITLDLATRMGERIAGAVAMAASAGPGLGNRGALARELEDVAAPARTDRTHLGTRAVIGSSVAPELRELIATMHRREDPVISNSDLLGWTSHDVTGRLGDVRCPLLVVGGSDDLWLDLDALRDTADLVPGGRALVLEGIGHYPPQEMTDFADVLHGWILDWKGTEA